MHLEDLRFPAFCFGRDRSIEVALTSDFFRWCTATAFERRYFEDLEVHDVRGVHAVVRSVAEARPRGALRRMLDRVRNPRIEVVLGLEAVGESTFAELKERLIQAIDADAEFWEAGWDLDELRRMVRGAGSRAELTELLM